MPGILRGFLKKLILLKARLSLRSFAKRIDINKSQAVIHYNLPLPYGEETQAVGVLPTVTPGGLSDPIAQPKIKTFFEVSLVPVD